MSKLLTGLLNLKARKLHRHNLNDNFKADKDNDVGFIQQRKSQAKDKDREYYGNQSVAPVYSWSVSPKTMLSLSIILLVMVFIVINLIPLYTYAATAYDGTSSNHSNAFTYASTFGTVTPFYEVPTSGTTPINNSSDLTNWLNGGGNNYAYLTTNFSWSISSAMRNNTIASNRTLDGNGYTITITSAWTGWDDMSVVDYTGINHTSGTPFKASGFFGGINYGTIKNLTLINNGDKWVRRSNDNATMGIIVGVNAGLIENVRVEHNAVIKFTVASNNRFRTLGGIAGINTGTIQYCQVDNNGTLRLQSGSEHGAVGGMVGLNHYIDSTYPGVVQYVKVTGVGSILHHDNGAQWAWVGGVVGMQRNQNCSGYNISWGKIDYIYSSFEGYLTMRSNQGTNEKFFGLIAGQANPNDLIHIIVDHAVATHESFPQKLTQNSTTTYNYYKDLPFIGGTSHGESVDHANIQVTNLRAGYADVGFDPAYPGKVFIYPAEDSVNPSAVKIQTAVDVIGNPTSDTTFVDVNPGNNYLFFDPNRKAVILDLASGSPHHTEDYLISINWQSNLDGYLKNIDSMQTTGTPIRNATEFYNFLVVNHTDATSTAYLACDIMLDRTLINYAPTDSIVRMLARNQTLYGNGYTIKLSISSPTKNDDAYNQESKTNWFIGNYGSNPIGFIFSSIVGTLRDTNFWLAGGKKQSHYNNVDNFENYGIIAGSLADWGQFINNRVVYDVTVLRYHDTDKAIRSGIIFGEIYSNNDDRKTLLEHSTVYLTNNGKLTVQNSDSSDMVALGAFGGCIWHGDNRNTFQYNTLKGDEGALLRIAQGNYRRTSGFLGVATGLNNNGDSNVRGIGFPATTIQDCTYDYNGTLAGDRVAKIANAVESGHMVRITDASRTTTFRNRTLTGNPGTCSGYGVGPISSDLNNTYNTVYSPVSLTNLSYYHHYYSMPEGTRIQTNNNGVGQDLVDYGYYYSGTTIAKNVSVTRSYAAVGYIFHQADGSDNTISTAWNSNSDPDFNGDAWVSGIVGAYNIATMRIGLRAEMKLVGLTDKVYNGQAMSTGEYKIVRWGSDLPMHNAWHEYSSFNKDPDYRFIDVYSSNFIQSLINNDVNYPSGTGIFEYIYDKVYRSDNSIAAGTPININARTLHIAELTSEQITVKFNALDLGVSINIHDIAEPTYAGTYVTVMPIQQHQGSGSSDYVYTFSRNSTSGYWTIYQIDTETKEFSITPVAAKVSGADKNKTYGNGSVYDANGSFNYSTTLVSGGGATYDTITGRLVAWDSVRNIIVDDIASNGNPMFPSVTSPNIVGDYNYIFIRHYGNSDYANVFSTTADYNTYVTTYLVNEYGSDTAKVAASFAQYVINQSYTFTVSSSGSYNVVNAHSGSLTINPRQLDVTINSQSRYYGECRLDGEGVVDVAAVFNDADFTFGVGGGLVTGDSFSGGLTVADPTILTDIFKAAGTTSLITLDEQASSIARGEEDRSACYTINMLSSDVYYTILKRHVTITAPTTSMFYGNLNSLNGFTWFIKSGHIMIPQSINISYQDGYGNYILNATIQDAPVPDGYPELREGMTSVADLFAQGDGFQINGSFSVLNSSLTDVTDTLYYQNVGDYFISQGTITTANNDNIIITFLDGDLEIEQRKIVIVPDADISTPEYNYFRREYYAANPTITYRVMYNSDDTISGLQDIEFAVAHGDLLILELGAGHMIGDEFFPVGLTSPVSRSVMYNYYAVGSAELNWYLNNYNNGYVYSIFRLGEIDVLRGEESVYDNYDIKLIFELDGLTIEEMELFDDYFRVEKANVRVEVGGNYEYGDIFESTNFTLLGAYTKPQGQSYFEANFDNVLGYQIRLRGSISGPSGSLNVGAPVGKHYIDVTPVDGFFSGDITNIYAFNKSGTDAQYYDYVLADFEAYYMVGGSVYYHHFFNFIPFKYDVLAGVSAYNEAPTVEITHRSVTVNAAEVNSKYGNMTYNTQDRLVEELLGIDAKSLIMRYGGVQGSGVFAGYAPLSIPADNAQIMYFKNMPLIQFTEIEIDDVIIPGSSVNLDGINYGYVISNPQDIATEIKDAGTYYIVLTIYDSEGNVNRNYRFVDSSGVAHYHIILYNDGLDTYDIGTYTNAVQPHTFNIARKVLQYNEQYQDVTYGVDSAKFYAGLFGNISAPIGMQYDSDLIFNGGPQEWYKVTAIADHNLTGSGFYYIDGLVIMGDISSYITIEYMGDTASVGTFKYRAFVNHINYSSEMLTWIEINILPKPITVIPTEAEKVYAAGVNTIDYNYTIDGALSSTLIDGVMHFELSGMAIYITLEGKLYPVLEDGVSPVLLSTPVGEYAINQGTLLDEFNPNYTITFETGVSAGKLIIVPSPVTIQIDSKTNTYGNSMPALTYKIVEGMFISSDNFTTGGGRALNAIISLLEEDLVTSTTSIGTYYINGNMSNPNYIFTYIGVGTGDEYGRFTVVPREVAFSFGNAITHEYDATNIMNPTSGSEGSLYHTLTNLTYKYGNNIIDNEIRPTINDVAFYETLTEGVLSDEVLLSQFMSMEKEWTMVSHYYITITLPDGDKRENYNWNDDTIIYVYIVYRIAYVTIYDQVITYGNNSLITEQDKVNASWYEINVFHPITGELVSVRLSDIYDTMGGVGNVDDWQTQINDTEFPINPALTSEVSASGKIYELNAGTYTYAVTIDKYMELVFIDFVNPNDPQGPALRYEYSLEVNAGHLTVKKRPINIEWGDFTRYFLYNGEAQGDYALSGTFNAGLGKYTYIDGSNTLINKVYVNAEDMYYEVGGIVYASTGANILDLTATVPLFIYNNKSPSYDFTKAGVYMIYAEILSSVADANNYCLPYTFTDRVDYTDIYFRNIVIDKAIAATGMAVEVSGMGRTFEDDDNRLKLYIRNLDIIADMIATHRENKTVGLSADSKWFEIRLFEENGEEIPTNRYMVFYEITTLSSSSNALNIKLTYDGMFYYEGQSITVRMLQRESENYHAYGKIDASIENDVEEQALIESGSSGWVYARVNPDSTVPESLNLSQWKSVSYNDSNWTSVTFPIGTDDRDDPTIVTSIPNLDAGFTPVLFFRHSFYIPEEYEYTSNDTFKFRLTIKYDDHPEVYLNGNLIWRASGLLTTANPYAVINLEVPGSYINSGENVLAISLQNEFGGSFLNLSFELVDIYYSYREYSIKTDLSGYKHLSTADANFAITGLDSSWHFLMGNRANYAEGTFAMVSAWEEKGWFLPDFDDSSGGWTTGKSPFGLASGTIIDNNDWWYFRWDFSIDSVDGINSLDLKVHYDDDLYGFLNGEFILFYPGAARTGENKFSQADSNRIIPYLKTGDNVIAFALNNRGGGGRVFNARMGYNDSDNNLVNGWDKTGWKYKATSTGQYAIDLTTRTVTNNRHLSIGIPYWDDANWFFHNLDEDDSGWLNGTAPFRHNSGSGTVISAEDRWLYARQKFTVANPAAIDSLSINIRYDEDLYVFINGTFAGFYNNHVTSATNIINSVTFPLFKDLLKPGENVIALAIRNGTGGGKYLDASIIANGATLLATGASNWKYKFGNMFDPIDDVLKPLNYSPSFYTLRDDVVNISGWNNVDYDTTGWGFAQGGFGNTTRGDRNPLTMRVGLPALSPNWDAYSDATPVDNLSSGHVGSPTGETWYDYYNNTLAARDYMLYTRKTFFLTQDQFNSVDALILKIQYDDNVYVYINGVEVFKGAGFITSLQTITLPASAKQALVAGNNVLAIVTRNITGGRYIDASLEYRVDGYYSEGANKLASTATRLKGTLDFAGSAEVSNIIGTGSTWKYFNNGRTVPNNDSSGKNWTSEDYTGDSGWGSGSNFNNNNNYPTNTDIFLRQTFDLSYVQVNQDLTFYIFYRVDDIIWVYINGTTIINNFNPGSTRSDYRIVSVSSSQLNLREKNNVVAVRASDTGGNTMVNVGVIVCPEVGSNRVVEQSGDPRIPFENLTITSNSLVIRTRADSNNSNFYHYKSLNGRYEHNDGNVRSFTSLNGGHGNERLGYFLFAQGNSGIGRDLSNAVTTDNKLAYNRSSGNAAYVNWFANYALNEKQSPWLAYAAENGAMDMAVSAEFHTNGGATGYTNAVYMSMNRIAAADDYSPAFYDEWYDGEAGLGVRGTNNENRYESMYLLKAMTGWPIRGIYGPHYGDNNTVSGGSQYSNIIVNDGAFIPNGSAENGWYNLTRDGDHTSLAQINAIEGRSVISFAYQSDTQFRRQDVTAYAASNNMLYYKALSNNYDPWTTYSRGGPNPDSPSSQPTGGHFLMSGTMNSSAIRLNFGMQTMRTWDCIRAEIRNINYASYNNGKDTQAPYLVDGSLVKIRSSANERLRFTLADDFSGVDFTTAYAVLSGNVRLPDGTVTNTLTVANGGLFMTGMRDNSRVMTFETCMIPSGVTVSQIFAQDNATTVSQKSAEAANYAATVALANSTTNPIATSNNKVTINVAHLTSGGKYTTIDTSNCSIVSVNNGASSTLSGVALTAAYPQSFGIESSYVIEDISTNNLGLIEADFYKWYTDFNNKVTVINDKIYTTQEFYIDVIKGRYNIDTVEVFKVGTNGLNIGEAMVPDSPPVITSNGNTVYRYYFSNLCDNTIEDRYRIVVTDTRGNRLEQIVNILTSNLIPTLSLFTSDIDYSNAAATLADDLESMDNNYGYWTSEQTTVAPYTLVEEFSTWKYITDNNPLTVDYANGWNTLQYNDSAWQSAQAGMYANTSQFTDIRNTDIGNTTANVYMFFRQIFVNNGEAGYYNLDFNVFQDDNTLIYINGNLVCAFESWSNPSTHPDGHNATVNNVYLNKGNNVIAAKVNWGYGGSFFLAKVTSTTAYNKTFYKNWQLEDSYMYASIDSNTTNLVQSESDWYYSTDTSNDDVYEEGWNTVDYTPVAGWAEAQSGFHFSGYYRWDGHPTNTEISPTGTYKFFRQSFIFNGPSGYYDLNSIVRYDDNAEIFINGVSVAELPSWNGTGEYLEFNNVWLDQGVNVLAARVAWNAAAVFDMTLGGKSITELKVSEYDNTVSYKSDMIRIYYRYALYNTMINNSNHDSVYTILNGGSIGETEYDGKLWIEVRSDDIYNPDTSTINMSELMKKLAFTDATMAQDTVFQIMIKTTSGITYESPMYRYMVDKRHYTLLYFDKGYLDETTAQTYSTLSYLQIENMINGDFTGGAVTPLGDGDGYQEQIFMRGDKVTLELAASSLGAIYYAFTQYQIFFTELLSGKLVHTDTECQVEGCENPDHYEWLYVDENTGELYFTKHDTNYNLSDTDEGNIDISSLHGTAWSNINNINWAYDSFGEMLKYRTLNLDLYFAGNDNPYADTALEMFTYLSNYVEYGLSDSARQYGEENSSYSASTAAGIPLIGTEADIDVNIHKYTPVGTYSLASAADKFRLNTLGNPIALPSIENAATLAQIEVYKGGNINITPRLIQLNGSLNKQYDGNSYYVTQDGTYIFDNSNANDYFIRANGMSGSAIISYPTSYEEKKDFMTSYFKINPALVTENELVAQIALLLSIDTTGLSNEEIVNDSFSALELIDSDLGERNIIISGTYMPAGHTIDLTTGGKYTFLYNLFNIKVGASTITGSDIDSTTILPSVQLMADKVGLVINVGVHTNGDIISQTFDITVPDNHFDGINANITGINENYLLRFITLGTDAANYHIKTTLEDTTNSLPAYQQIYLLARALGVDDSYYDPLLLAILTDGISSALLNIYSTAIDEVEYTEEYMLFINEVLTALVELVEDEELYNAYLNYIMGRAELIEDISEYEINIDLVDYIGCITKTHTNLIYLIVETAEGCARYSYGSAQITPRRLYIEGQNTYTFNGGISDFEADKVYWYDYTQSVEAQEQLLSDVNNGGISIYYSYLDNKTPMFGGLYTVVGGKTDNPNYMINESSIVLYQDQTYHININRNMTLLAQRVLTTERNTIWITMENMKSKAFLELVSHPSLVLSINGDSYYTLPTNRYSAQLINVNEDGYGTIRIAYNGDSNDPYLENIYAFCIGSTITEESDINHSSNIALSRSSLSDGQVNAHSILGTAIGNTAELYDFLKIASTDSNAVGHLTNNIYGFDWAQVEPDIIFDYDYDATGSGMPFLGQLNGNSFAVFLTNNTNYTGSVSSTTQVTGIGSTWSPRGLFVGNNQGTIRDITFIYQGNTQINETGAGNINRAYGIVSGAMSGTGQFTNINLLIRGNIKYSYDSGENAFTAIALGGLTGLAYNNAEITNSTVEYLYNIILNGSTVGSNCTIDVKNLTENGSGKLTGDAMFGGLVAYTAASGSEAQPKLRNISALNSRASILVSGRSVYAGGLIGYGAGGSAGLIVDGIINGFSGDITADTTDSVYESSAIRAIGMVAGTLNALNNQFGTDLKMYYNYIAPEYEPLGSIVKPSLVGEGVITVGGLGNTYRYAVGTGTSQDIATVVNGNGLPFAETAEHLGYGGYGFVNYFFAKQTDVLNYGKLVIEALSRRSSFVWNVYTFDYFTTEVGLDINGVDISLEDLAQKYAHPFYYYTEDFEQCETAIIEKPAHYDPTNPLHCSECSEYFMHLAINMYRFFPEAPQELLFDEVYPTRAECPIHGTNYNESCGLCEDTYNAFIADLDIYEAALDYYHEYVLNTAVYTESLYYKLVQAVYTYIQNSEHKILPEAPLCYDVEGHDRESCDLCLSYETIVEMHTYYHSYDYDNYDYTGRCAHLSKPIEPEEVEMCDEHGEDYAQHFWYCEKCFEYLTYLNRYNNYLLYLADYELHKENCANNLLGRKLVYQVKGVQDVSTVGFGITGYLSGSGGSSGLVYTRTYNGTDQAGTIASTITVIDPETGNPIEGAVVVDIEQEIKNVGVYLMNYSFGSEQTGDYLTNYNRRQIFYSGGGAQTYTITVNIIPRNTNLIYIGSIMDKVYDGNAYGYIQASMHLDNFVEPNPANSLVYIQYRFVDQYGNTNADAGVNKSVVFSMVNMDSARTIALSENNNYNIQNGAMYKGTISPKEISVSSYTNTKQSYRGDLVNMEGTPDDSTLAYLYDGYGNKVTIMVQGVPTDLRETVYVWADLSLLTKNKQVFNYADYLVAQYKLKAYASYSDSHMDEPTGNYYIKSDDLPILTLTYFKMLVEQSGGIYEQVIGDNGKGIFLVEDYNDLCYINTVESGKLRYDLSLIGDAVFMAELAILLDKDILDITLADQYAEVINRATAATMIVDEVSVPFTHSYLSYNFLQTNDIEGSNKRFIPINAFSGIYDGAEYSITNIVIIEMKSTTGYISVGLFRELLSGGIIKSVRLLDTSINVYAPQSYVGGIVGRNVLGEIIDCYYEGEIYAKGINGGSAGTIYAGGIAGINATVDIGGGTLVSGNIVYSGVLTKIVSQSTLSYVNAVAWGNDLYKINNRVFNKDSTAANYTTLINDKNTTVPECAIHLEGYNDECQDCINYRKWRLANNIVDILFTNVYNARLLPTIWEDTNQDGIADRDTGELVNIGTSSDEFVIKYYHQLVLLELYPWASFMLSNDISAFDGYIISRNFKGNIVMPQGQDNKIIISASDIAASRTSPNWSAFSNYVIFSVNSYNDLKQIDTYPGLNFVFGRDIYVTDSTDFLNNVLSKNIGGRLTNKNGNEYKIYVSANNLFSYSEAVGWAHYEQYVVGRIDIDIHTNLTTAYNFGQHSYTWYRDRDCTIPLTGSEIVSASKGTYYVRLND